MQKTFRDKAQENVEAIIENGPALVTDMETSLSTLFTFSSLKDAETEFEQFLKAGSEQNAVPVPPVLATALPSVREYISTVVANIQAIEKYISLNFPAIEDGNNFGVSVQLAILKMLKESRESLVSEIKTIGVTYYDTRANAVDKVGLKKKSVSTTSTTSENDTSSSIEGEKSGHKSSSSSSTEEKESGSSVVDSYRMYHLLAVDVQAYFEAKSAMSNAIDKYCSILDNVEKNYEKLSAPKGTSGGTSHMGMF